MVNERDEKLELQEEGEYQFTDDEEVNYEVEPDTSKTTATASGKNIKENVVEKISQYRRLIIGIVIFVVLMVTVYKMLAPTQSLTPPSEIAQGTLPAARTMAPPAAVQSPVNPVNNNTVPSSPIPVSQPPINVAPPMPSAPLAQPNNTAMPPQPVAEIAAPLPTAQQPAAAPVSQQQPVTPPRAPIVPVSSTPTYDAIQSGAAVMTRLTMVEQQNAQIANTMQSEYAQKLAEYDTQNRVLQGKVQNLTMRLANLEAAINQLTDALQGGKAPLIAGSPTQPPPSARLAEPKISYTVQAIIPGRAWLKSESGDTVTVAEGDILKDYGRVTKIDPYDGIVEIDMNGKMISLSYGVSAE